MQLQINNFCNQSCKHCYLEQSPEKISLEQYDIILNKFINENKGITVALIGGEPCLHPDLVSMIKRAPKQAELGILTNGTAFSDEIISAIKERNGTIVQISIEGTEEIHNAIRGEGNYEKVIQGIKKLTESKIEVHISFTANNFNYKTIEDVMKNMYELGVNFVWADRIIPVQNNFLQALTTEQFIEFNKLFYRASKKYKNKSYIWRALQFLEDPKHIPFYSCGAGRHWNVKVDGNMVLCARMPIDTGMNALVHSTEEINKTLFQIANYIPNECIGCEHEKKCMGGLKCLTWHKYHDLDKKDPNCPIKNSRI